MKKFLSICFLITLTFSGCKTTLEKIEESETEQPKPIVEKTTEANPKDSKTRIAIEMAKAKLENNPQYIAYNPKNLRITNATIARCDNCYVIDFLFDIPTQDIKKRAKVSIQEENISSINFCEENIVIINSRICKNMGGREVNQDQETCSQEEENIGELHDDIENLICCVKNIQAN